jgi:NAD-dependent SIR2 family protein deacetylase
MTGSLNNTIIGQGIAGVGKLSTIGTSGSVQPVASFVAMLKQRAKPSRRIFVGLTEPENARHFDEVHLGPATEKVAQALRSLT